MLVFWDDPGERNQTQRVGHPERKRMNLKQYFKDEPRGAKKEMAEYLGITPTWLGLLIRKARRPSPELSKKIEKATQGLVKAKDLRPDLFD
jgi:DNA-binding transcriptional regulator YdaS (Cro superfamily)